LKKPRPNPLADAPVSGAVLQADRVSLAAPWGSGYLLQDLSFKLGPGELVALIGPSGSGKTTLLRLLNFLLEPTTGTIALNGENIRDLSVIQLRRRVGLLLQEAKLLGMTVGQAIAYPLQLRGYPRAEVERQVEYWREIGCFISRAVEFSRMFQVLGWIGWNSRINWPRVREQIRKCGLERQADRGLLGNKG